MFKFLKELVAEIKEGYEEGKQELADERRAETIGELWRLDNITREEQFGTALGAVYRDIFTGVMRRRDDDDPAVFLQVFALPEKEKAGYAKLLKRDFDIVDGPTAKKNIDHFWRELRGDVDPETGEQQSTGYATVYSALSQSGTFDTSTTTHPDHSNNQVEAVQDFEEKYGLGEQGGDAFRLSVLSHIICGSCGLGYLTEDEAQDLITPVISRAKNIYGNWPAFADGFKAGELAWGHTNAMGRKVITKTVDTLVTHKASPWQTITW